MSPMLADLEDTDRPADDPAAVRRVTLLGTETSFEVEPGESILAAALRANIHLAHDCKSGTCATCRFRIVEGAVAYVEEPMGLLPEEAAEGYGLACQARPLSDIVAEAEVRPALIAEPARHTAIVRHVGPLSDEVMHLVLEVPEEVASTYRPGQYLNVVVGDGKVRSFSMASPPNGRTVDLHIRRIAGGQFTSNRLPGLTPGEELEVELPHGMFFLRTDDFRPLLMLATGTGLAPIKSILQSLLDDPDCPPVTLYRGARTEADLYLDAEIRSWADRLPDFRYIPVLSRPQPGSAHRTGYVQDAATEDIEDFSEYGIYLCGSPIMVSASKSLFISRGASINHIYADSFLFQHNLGR
ncbi:MAG: 2Fe-2S iron-sulfur cluster-binding protein [Devosia sp.]|nr:2Fe-2S iron-sulfur cluster-binding protein [Devosia sp.]